MNIFKLGQVWWRISRTSSHLPNGKLEKVEEKNSGKFFDAQALNQMIPGEACLPKIEFETIFSSPHFGSLLGWFAEWKWWSHSPSEVMKLLAWVSPVSPTSAKVPRHPPIRLPGYLPQPQLLPPQPPPSTHHTHHHHHQGIVLGVYMLPTTTAMVPRNPPRLPCYLLGCRSTVYLRVYRPTFWWWPLSILQKISFCDTAKKYFTNIIKILKISTQSMR